MSPELDIDLTSKPDASFMPSYEGGSSVEKDEHAKGNRGALASHSVAFALQRSVARRINGDAPSSASRALPRPPATLRCRASSAERDPGWGMIARVRLAAHPLIDARFAQLGRKLGIEQQMIDAQTGVAFPMAAKVIPERVHAVVRIFAAK